MSGEEVKIPVKLFVSKFPASFSEDELRQVCSSHYFIFIVLSKVFTPFGELESLVILKQKDPSRPQSCGFVRFASISDAIRAIRELNGKHMIDPVCNLIPLVYILL
jgi:RNA recognition motif-containing protein